MTRKVGVSAASGDQPTPAEHAASKTEDDSKTQAPEVALANDPPEKTGVAVALPPPPPAADSGADGGIDIDSDDGRQWQDLPEIILFWARNRRKGGNLVVCPDTSMDRLVQAYLVCEVVEHSEKVKG